MDGPDSSRRKVVLDKIRAGEEMTVSVEQIEFSEQSPFSPKNSRLRLWLSLYRLDLPFLTNLARRRIASLTKCSGADTVPGFRCLYGNIICDSQVGLHDTHFVDYANVYCGKGTSFSFQNIVITSTHDLRNMKVVRASEVIIGENVWITSRVVILPGVRIGRNSVVGAGSVVAHDIPPNVFAAGSPAEPIKTIDRGDLYRLSQQYRSPEAGAQP